MYLAIFIFIVLIWILSTDIHLNIKSANDTIKLDAKFGLIRFVIPHHRLIEKAIVKAKQKNINEQRNDFKKLIENRRYFNRLFKHSSLSMFYMARFTKEELYLNPIQNGVYLIISNQIKAYFKNHFKRVDEDNIKLIYDQKYQNIDYFICLKTDFISLLAILFIKN